MLLDVVWGRAALVQVDTYNVKITVQGMSTYHATPITFVDNNTHAEDDCFNDQEVDEATE